MKMNHVEDLPRIWQHTFNCRHRNVYKQNNASKFSRFKATVKKNEILQFFLEYGQKRWRFRWNLFCWHVWVCTCLCVCTWMCFCVRVWVCAYMRVRLPACVYVCLFVFIFVCVRACVLTCVRACVCFYLCVFVYALQLYQSVLFQLALFIPKSCCKEGSQYDESLRKCQLEYIGIPTSTGDGYLYKKVLYLFVSFVIRVSHFFICSYHFLILCLILFIYGIIYFYFNSSVYLLSDLFIFLTHLFFLCLIFSFASFYYLLSHLFILYLICLSCNSFLYHISNWLIVSRLFIMSHLFIVRLAKMYQRPICVYC